MYSALQDIEIGSNEFTVKTDQLPSGIYSLQISSENGAITKKISIVN
jgi:hypothetical protein